MLPLYNIVINDFQRDGTHIWEVPAVDHDPLIYIYIIYIYILII